MFFLGNLRQFPRTFMSKVGLDSDVINDVLFIQEDKDCLQVKMWPTHSSIIHQINSFKFWPIKRGIWHTFRHLGCSDQDHALYYFLYIFVMFKFYFMLYFP